MIAENARAIECPYRIGDYLCTENSTHPSVSWPGTSWEQVHGKMLLGSSEEYPAGSEGGSKTHRHPLSSAGYASIGNYAERTAFFNSGKRLKDAASEAGITAYSWTHNVDSPFTSSDSHYTELSAVILGGNTDNADALPPYRAVYIYRRIA